MRNIGRARVLVAVVVGLVASACSDGGPSEIERTAASSNATLTTTTAVAPVTTARPSVTAAPTTLASATTLAGITTPTTPPPGLGTGARGAEVAALEKRLDAL